MIGKPDLLVGEMPTAFIVLKEGYSCSAEG